MLLFVFVNIDDDALLAVYPRNNVVLFFVFFFFWQHKNWTHGGWRIKKESHCRSPIWSILNFYYKIFSWGIHGIHIWIYKENTKKKSIVMKDREAKINRTKWMSFLMLLLFKVKFGEEEKRNFLGVKCNLIHVHLWLDVWLFLSFVHFFIIFYYICGRMWNPV